MKPTIRMVTLVFFIAALGVGIALRLASIAGKDALDTDEATSYLMAAANFGDYIRARDEGRLHEQWLSGETWRAFIEPDALFDFQAIADDLARYDIHPPLYYSLLHVWELIFGVSIEATAALNLLIEAVTVAVLLRFGTMLFRSALPAMLVVSLWLLRPVSLNAMLIARDYVLYALWGALYAWLIYILLYRREARALTVIRGLALALVTAAGMLTHYQFPLVIGSGALAVVARYRGMEGRRLRDLFLSILAGGALAFAFGWRISSAFARQGRLAEGFNLRELDNRIERAVNQMMRMFVDNIQLHVEISSYSRLVPLAVVTAILALILLALAIRNRRRLGAWARRLPLETHTADLYLLCYLFVIAGTMIALYLAFVSQPHTLGDRYLSIVWVFAAFLPVILVRLMPARWQVAAATLLRLYSIAIFISALAVSAQRMAETSAQFPIANDDMKVVIDNQNTGIVFDIVFHLDDADAVYVAGQETLLAQPESWLSRLQADGGLFVTIPDIKGGTQERTDALLEMLRAGGMTVTPIETEWVYRTYRVTAEGRAVSSSLRRGHKSL